MLAILFLISGINVYADNLEYTALYVGSNKAFVNDVEQQIDTENPNVKVFVENDRSYVPVRFISENYDGQVEWVQETENNVTKRKRDYTYDSSMNLYV